MSDEKDIEGKSNDDGWARLDKPDVTQNHFSAVLNLEGIAQAVKEYLVRQADLPPCHHRGVVLFCHLKDGGLEAVADVTWWPEGTPEPPLSNLLKEQGVPL